MIAWIKRYRWYLIAAAVAAVLVIGVWLGWRWALMLAGAAAGVAGRAAVKPHDPVPEAQHTGEDALERQKHRRERAERIKEELR